MYRVLISLLPLLISCSSVSENLPSPEIDYGDHMFQMDCIWDNGFSNDIDDLGTVVYCYGFSISSEIIEADFFSLAVQYPENLEERVRVCGENMHLYSGHDLYDGLLSALTNNQYGCINAFDGTKNDEFDWYWFDEERILEFNWRPEDKDSLDMFLVIEEPKYGTYLYLNGYASTAAIYLKKNP